MVINNPFITGGYVSPEYFCDREHETKQLLHEIANGNHLALVSTRRMGKTGLIQHCFNNEMMKTAYHTFFVDIYASKSLRDFVFLLSKSIVEDLKPMGRHVLKNFATLVKSVQAGISFDIAGNPAFNIGLGDIKSSETTLEEIFAWLNKADKPCIVAIDEFQQIAGYAENDMEAILRTHIQHCKNCRFIFAGSQRHMMGNIFLSASRPFYQSVSMMHLNSIELSQYIEFACRHFKKAGKGITPDTISAIYEKFEGVTWYVQKMLNVLYGNTPKGAVCSLDMIPGAIAEVVNSYKYTYSEILFRLPEKQKELLIAIAKEGKATALTSGVFVHKYKLTSASSAQVALRGLLAKDFVTQEAGEYRIYDKFFGIWLVENY